jgi:hypothetical protein
LSVALLAEGWGEVVEAAGVGDLAGDRDDWPRAEFV